MTHEELWKSVEEAIKSACNHLESKTPANIWSTACDALLSKYPIDHIAWGYGEKSHKKDILRSPITYELVSSYSNKHMNSWNDIKQHAYDIAYWSSSWDTQCSAIGDAIRCTYHTFYKKSQARRMNTSFFGICRFCWRLAPLEGITWRQQTCEIHKSHTAEYQKARKYLNIANREGEILKNFNDPHLATLLNSVFPMNPQRTLPDLPTTTMRDLAAYYPHAFRYLQEEKKVNITDMKQIIEGLVGDSAESPPLKNLVENEISRMFSNPAYVAGHLDSCEAWLRAYKTRSLGGKRLRAGRSKTNTERISAIKSDILQDHKSGMNKRNIVHKYKDQDISRSTIYRIISKSTD